MHFQWPNKLDEASFLQQYWQTRPLLIRQAFPELAESGNPISRDELGGLAMEADVTSRIILRESDTQWHCRYGPFEQAELEELPAEDWTLLVSDIEKHLPELRNWIKPFHFIPQWRIDDLMISYAPKGASVGAHTDNYDVFLLQAAGTREWSITENPEADRSLLPDLDIGVLANFEAENTWVLEPGDMLYLPPGTPHHGVSKDDDCMTWSIGFRAPSHREIVTDIAERLAQDIPEEAFYSDPGILLHEHSGQISPNVVTRIREIWNSYVLPDNEHFEDLVGHLLTRANSSDEPFNAPPPAYTALDETNAGSADEAAAKARDQLLAHLDAEGSWERDSFANFAFVPQSRLAESEEKPPAKMLKKIKATVSRSSSDDETLADAEDHSQTQQMNDKKPLNVTLYANGQGISCTETLATTLTGEFQYGATELIESCNDLQDSTALQWLIDNGMVQPVSQSGN